VERCADRAASSCALDQQLCLYSRAAAIGNLPSEAARARESPITIGRCRLDRTVRAERRLFVPAQGHPRRRAYRPVDHAVPRADPRQPHPDPGRASPRGRLHRRRASRRRGGGWSQRQDDSTVLHVTSLALVAAGDVVYNHVHQYLAETAAVAGRADITPSTSSIPCGPPAWSRGTGRDPRRRPGCHRETRRYLDDSARLLAKGPSQEEFFDRMLGLYPDRINPYIVWLSAARWR
jgi:hypothetical protein